jgi:Tfp pilus assembly protein PilP
MPPPSAAATATAPARTLPGIRYLGSLQQGATRFLFAEVNGQVYSVRAGSDLGGLYRLEAIDQRQARFVYLPTHENILVSLD